MKTFIYSLFIFMIAGIFGFVAPSAFAQSVSTPITANTYAIGETFAVPILVASPDIAVNAFSIEVSYPTFLEFVGSDEQGSVVGLWVEQPTVVDGKILFSGAMSSGFTETYNPLNKQRSPGLLTKLIFRGTEPDSGAITAVPELLAHDGKGTVLAASGFSVRVAIDSRISTDAYVWDDTVLPESFMPYVQKHDSVFDGKYVVIFNTIDKDSGIARYEVKEGSGRWLEAKSPYLLNDQSLHSVVAVRAIDKAGNMRMEAVPAPRGSETSNSISMFTALIICLLVVGVFVYHRHRKRNEA
ncbi:MAG TPA: hypothetical protein PK950_02715 [Candidatus Paceibacterota bacterium]|nr:hypothetical protein [Candidatus Paceibacterota bacterium]